MTTPPPPKKICLDTPDVDTSDSSCASMVESCLSLKIIGEENDPTGKIIELSDEELITGSAKRVAISDFEDLLSEKGRVYFQDNTMVFETLLTLKKLNLVIYPPGSGKTTVALLLKAFLSSEALSDNLNEFFTNCKFSACQDLYEKYHKKANVAYISFKSITAHNEKSLER